MGSGDKSPCRGHIPGLRDLRDGTGFPYGFPGARIPRAAAGCWSWQASLALLPRWWQVSPALGFPWPGLPSHGSFPWLPAFPPRRLSPSPLPFLRQGEMGLPGQKGSKGDKGEAVSAKGLLCPRRVLRGAERLRERREMGTVRWEMFGSCPKPYVGAPVPQGPPGPTGIQGPIGHPGPAVSRCRAPFSPRLFLRLNLTFPS